jgi:hypoxanthine phosphoribosyltransferase
MENLVGKRILIVDEVDDTRTTLEYAVKELEKDVELARQKLGGKGEKTVFSIFVLHVSPQSQWKPLLWQTITDISTEQEQRKERPPARRHAQR